MIARIVGICAAILGLVLIAGCGGPLQMADPARAAQAKTFATNAERANVYVYRNEILGGVVRMAITVDGKEMGLTRGKNYLLLSLEPGQHTLVSQGQAQLALKLDVAAGRNYFVWQEVKHTFGTFTYRSLLQLVDEATGRQGVEECELVATSP